VLGRYNQNEKLLLQRGVEEIRSSKVFAATKLSNRGVRIGPYSTGRSPRRNFKKLGSSFCLLGSGGWGFPRYMDKVTVVINSLALVTKSELWRKRAPPLRNVRKSHRASLFSSNAGLGPIVIISTLPLRELLTRSLKKELWGNI